jgi:hypothetical protein
MRARGGFSGPGIAVTILVIATVAFGAYVIESPAEARLLRMDARRVEDLRNARGAIDAYWRAHGRLPVSLDTLTPSGLPLPDFHDPATGLPYAYHITTDSTYEVCAVFVRAYAEDGPAGFREIWSHPAGRHCFDLKADRGFP